MAPLIVLGSCFWKERNKSNYAHPLQRRKKSKVLSVTEGKLVYGGTCLPGYFVTTPKLPVIFNKWLIRPFYFYLIMGKCHYQFVTDKLSIEQDVSRKFKPIYQILLKHRSLSFFSSYSPFPVASPLSASERPFLLLSTPSRQVCQSSAPPGETWWCCFSGWPPRWPPAATTTAWS